MFRLILRLVRFAFLAVLGVAVAAKFLLQSNASEETQEIDLVTIFSGDHLVSKANPFYGGKVTTVFGGTLLDLRGVVPAPTGIFLDVLVVMGGLNLVVPEGWRVTFDGKVLAGGFDDATRTTADPDTPILRLGGTVCFGGLRATNVSPVDSSQA